MSKLGPEPIVKIKSSDNSPKKFSTYVENPYIIPLFELLKNRYAHLLRLMMSLLSAS